jgi:hypothetical protein
MFVALPPQVDLSGATFLPITQHANALRVATVALEDLPSIAALMPEPRQRIFLFSMGRCGTTLVSKILSLVPEVWSLSEPHAFMTLALARNQMDLAAQATLIAAVTRLMYRPRGAQQDVLALKFHSQCLFHAELFFAAFPTATFIFQYRDGEAWANSFSHFLQNLGVPLKLDRGAGAVFWQMGTATAPLALLERVLDLDTDFTHASILAPIWALQMQEFLRLRSKGVPFFPMRYNALTSDPQGTLQALLAHCHLTAPDRDRLQQVLAADSQQGTQIARGKAVTSFTAEDYRQFKLMLARFAPDMPSGLVL